MPVFEVTAPNGKVYEVNAPDGATEDQAIAYMQGQLQKKQYFQTPDYAEAPETTLGGHAKEFLKGMGSGAIGLAETAGTGFASMLSDKLEKQGREAMKEGLSGAKEYLKADKGYEDTMSRKLGEGLGSTLPFFAAAPFAAVTSGFDLRRIWSMRSA